MFVRRESPYKDLKSLVEAAKKKPVNVALSRIPHPATIGMMALAEATGAQFNYIPYGGGNPTFTAMLTGETDVGALPIANVLARKEFKVLGVFNDKNIFAAQTENAPAVNSVFGTSIPELSSSRSWAVHAEWANANPEAVRIPGEHRQGGACLAGVPRGLEEDRATRSEALVWGDRKTCHDYAESMVKLAHALREADDGARQEEVASGDRGGRRHEQSRRRRPEPPARAALGADLIIPLLGCGAHALLPALDARIWSGRRAPPAR